MPFARKSLALAAGAMFALSAAAISPSRAQQPARRGAETISVDDATVDWIEWSEVAALIEGNVESIELDLGKTVRKGAPIGYLNRAKAHLTVAKAKVAAAGEGAIHKAMAQYDNALSTVARNDRMLKKDPNLVPREDQEKAKAELKVTQAMIEEAKENLALAKAEFDLAQNQLKEHTITAPFTGVVIKWLKHPGESVNAREAVIELGNLDKLRVYAYIPLEDIFRVQEGMVVDLEPHIYGSRGGQAAAEAKKYRGKISFVDPQVQSINERTVRIYADFDNAAHELRPGMKGKLTVYLDPQNAARVGRAEAPAEPEPVVPASTASAPAGGVDLPPLPR